MSKQVPPAAGNQPDAGIAPFILLFQKHPVPMWIYDRETLACLDANDAAVKAYGYTRAAFLTMRLADICPPGEAPGPALEYSGEKRHRLKDGKVIAVEITSQTLEFKGRPAVLVMAQDISARKQAEDELARHAENMAILSQVSQQMQTLLELDQVYAAAHAAVRRFMPCDAFMISLLDETGEAIEYAYLWDDNQRWPSQRCRREKGLVDFVISSGQPLRVNNWGPDHDLLTGASLFGNLQRDTSSALATPLLDQSGRCFGVISAQAYAPNAYSIDQERLLITLASQVSKTIENARLVARLQFELAERQQAEQVLAQSEQRFRALIEQAPDGIVIFGASGRIEYASPTTTRIMGFLASEIIDQDPASLTHPDDLEALVTELQRAIQSPGQTIQAAYRMRHKDGSWRWLESNISNFFAVPGIQGLVFNFRDITERKLAEAARQESEEKYHTMFEASTDAIFLETIDGRVLDANTAACQMFGYTRDEFLQMTVADLTTSEIAATLPGVITQEMATGGIFIRTVNKRKDGQVFPAEVSTQVARVAGQPHVIAYVRDVSERERAAEALTRRMQDLVALYETSLEINSQPELSRLLPAIVERAARLAGAPMGGLYLMRPDARTLELVVSHNLPGDYTGTLLASGEGLSGRVAQTGKTMTVENYHDWEGQAGVYSGSPFRRVLAVPLKVENHVIGVINVTDSECKAPYSDEEIRSVTLLANQAAIAIHNAQLYADSLYELAERKRMEEALLQQTRLQRMLVNTALTYITLAPENVEAAINQSLAEFGALIGADRAYIFAYDFPAGVCQNTHEWCAAGITPQITKLQAVRLDGFPAWVTTHRRGQDMDIPDVDALPPGELKAVLAPQNIKSLLAVPMMDGTTCAGFVGFDAVRQMRTYSEDEKSLVRVFAGLLVNVEHRKRADQKLRESEERYRSLFLAEQRQAQELELLHEARTAIARQVDLSDIFRVTVEAISRTFGYTLVSLYLLEGDLEAGTGNLVLQHAAGYDQVITRIPISQGVSGRVARSGQPVLIQDVRADPDFLEAVEGIVSEISVPLIDQGRVAGMRNVESRQGVVLTDVDLRLMVALSEHVSIAIGKARLYEAARASEKKYRQLSTLLRLMADTMPDMLWAKNLKQEYIFANQAMCEKLLNAVDTGEPLGKTDLFFATRERAAYPENPEWHTFGEICRDSDTITLQEMKPMQFDEFGNVKGQFLFLDVHKAPLFDDDGQLIGVVGSARDVTARKHSEELLKQTSQELMLAYDATLQGWSHALELREQETAGHSRRVVEMTLHLARAIGIPEGELIHIQRGTLLHDIGKMGIPDSILLKPGRLNPDEWEIMHMHPLFAYNMLSAIPYLAPAIDIPRYHHEKWDGTGYPYGLQGTDIPLAARIFTLIDVWDALSNNRPYRPALPEAEVLRYIQEQSGKSFDPQITEVFLQRVLPGKA